MNIAISGATGLIGSALSETLKEHGHRVTMLTREDFSGGVNHLTQKLEGMHGVVNLAGAPILKRWTPEWKHTIYQSRVETTSLLVAAINGLKKAPKVFVSASATGIYDTVEVHDEYSTAFAKDFLGEVCTDWESEAMKVDKRKVRLVILRLGIVLARQGGALKQLLLPFKLGLGGKVGDGLQAMPFIHLHDLVNGIEWALTTHGKKGVFNMVAPQIISNGQFTRALGKALHRPTFMTVPQFVLTTLYGEGASVLTQGQKVVSARLKEEGFVFEFPDVELALKDLVK